MAVIPWYWHLQKAGVFYCNQDALVKATVASTGLSSWSKVSAVVHDPLNPGVPIATPAVPSPIASPDLSQYRASAVLHYVFMPSKPIALERLLHTTKFDCQHKVHTMLATYEHSWHVMTLGKHFSENLPHWCWSLINHSWVFRPQLTSIHCPSKTQVWLEWLLVLVNHSWCFSSSWPATTEASCKQLGSIIPSLWSFTSQSSIICLLSILIFQVPTEEPSQ